MNDGPFGLLFRSPPWARASTAVPST